MRFILQWIDIQWLDIDMKNRPVADEVCRETNGFPYQMVPPV